MTVIARRIASVPARSAVDTWSVIVDLIAPDPSSDARSDLEAVAGVAQTMIASEVSGPFVIFGSGPRVRIYCVFGDDALTDDGVNENPLPDAPTDGDWHLSIPCPSEDLDWVQRKLASAPRVSARDQDAAVEEDSTAAGTAHIQRLAVDKTAFFRS